jgi:hypothetical protein
LVQRHLWTRAYLAPRYASIFDDADLEPLRNQAQDALVRDTVFEEADDPIAAATRGRSGASLCRRGNPP